VKRKKIQKFVENALEEKIATLMSVYHLSKTVDSVWILMIAKIAKKEIVQFLLLI